MKNYKFGSSLIAHKMEKKDIVTLLVHNIVMPSEGSRANRDKGLTHWEH